MQVSARSGPYATYPTKVGVPNPDMEGFDTLATWRAVTRKLRTRLHIYYNIIDDPKLTADHPEWMRVDAAGNKSRLCNRPSADGSGYLESVMIPMIREIIERYEPDGFWFDGDWQIPQVCYCRNCKAAWKQFAGRDEPPKDLADPDWARWVTLEQERLDEYKQKLAAAIHHADPNCMYTSNWSWAIRYRDPRTAPEYADTLSGDVGAGESRNALYGCRYACLMLSAQEHTAHDVMSAIYPKKVRALPRMLQEGGLVMSSGSSWFVWVNNLTPDQFQHLRTCVGLVDARREALGQTHSLNPIAVLLSETSWEVGLTSSEQGYYDSDTPRNLGFALQDAYYGVDVVNEQTLRERISQYRIVFVPEQRAIASETQRALFGFVVNGGNLIVTGGGLRASDNAPLWARDWLGVTRRQGAGRERRSLEVAGERVALRGAWDVDVGDAEVLARFADSDLPALTSNGRVAYLALSGFPYPDEDGLALWLMEKLDIPPMVCVSGGARDRHLVFSVRRRGEGQVILHVSDLTTYAGERRIEPNSSHAIDAIRPIPELTLSLPLLVEPQSVNVLPATCTVASSWENGVLRLILRNFNTQAAVIMETQPPDCMVFLPPGAEPAPARKYPEPPVLLSEDFESTAVGKFPETAIWTAQDDAKTSIHVTDEAAAGGTRSLVFEDAPDARASFVPYLMIRPPRLQRGRARLSLDLRLEPGARANIELRDEEIKPYLVGPSLRFTEEGKLLAHDKELATFAVGEWMHVEIVFGLGYSEPKYDLTVARRGQAQQQFRELPYRDPAFFRCTWAGITSYGTARSKFFVDNIRLERVPE